MARKQLKYWVGFDLGGTKMQANVYTENWKIEGQRRRKTKGYEGVKEGLGRMIDTLREALQESGVMPSRLGGIGVGCPGPLDLQRGVILDTPNLGWKKVPVKAVLEKEFKCPVVIANDVDVGTYGEYVGGAAKGARCALGVFPGTGIGGGLVYNGDIFHGAQSSCLEIGHICVQPDGPLCGCGRRGCLEAVCSRLAIASACIEAAYRGQAPHLLKLAGTDLDKIRSGILLQAIKEGDTIVEKILIDAARALGDGLASLVNILAPDVVVLGGGLVEAMPVLYRREVEARARAVAMAPFRHHFKLRVASLGDDAASLGAAAWARRVVVEHRNR